ncbi:MAG: 3-ketosteroid 9alpha-monooxygenase subunit A [Myxococcota bacterium]
MAGRFPFPAFPKGWFQVAWSSELEAGAVKPLRYFGKDLVLFRGEDGEAHLLDAFCPHLGAHLGHGGVVKGNDIECPFHAWTFDGAGRCSNIPYAKKVPKKSALNAWTIREQGGLIIAWHHPQGAEPDFELPETPELEGDGWSDPVHLSWIIKTCNQEMAENSVDAAHFQYLHGTAGMPETVATPHGAVLHAESKILMTVGGNKIPGAIDVHCHGFGYTTTRFKGLVETLLVSSATAIEEELTEIRFTFIVKKLGGASTTAGIGRAFVKEVSIQLEQDIPIWENKIYVDPPMLCDGDGPVGIFRKWAKQFYPGWSKDQTRASAA